MKRISWVAAILVMPIAGLMLMAAAGPHPATVRPAGVSIIDNTTQFDANSLLMFVSNTGSFAYDATSMLGKNDGLYFPQGTNKSVIFAAGIWMGAKVDGGIRTAAAEYSNDYVPGPMANGTFQADRGSFRVYKIETGDLRSTSVDYEGWPFDDGAPSLKTTAGDDSLDADGYKIPLLIGDQALWSVYNEASVAGRESDPGSGSAGPMGVEIQHYVWGYRRSGSLGQTIFMRFTIINKGSNRLDSTFVSLWADPDLGDSGDDLVGCDTLLSLGYCYNSGEDAIYGAAAPSVGFDFLQGPIIPGEAGDSAWVSSKGQWIRGYRNLPMTSFNKYINGTDPQSNIETYNYMLGLTKEGEAQINPKTGQVTTFMLTGDPVNDPGGDSTWVDDNAADRRWMMTCGPFTMNPGDTQEVVAAILVGQGESPTSSITALKQTDEAVQATFDLNFNIPGPPPQPTIWVIPNDGALQLIWGLEADGNVQYGYGAPDSTGERPIVQTFVTEGFNIYQGQSNTGPWTKIATYDVDNDVDRIYMDLNNAAGKERTVVQRGTNTGLAHDLWITQDRIRGGSIVNNRPYYFTVTSYNYDMQNVTSYEIGPNVYGIIAEALENFPGCPQDGYVPRSMTGVLADTVVGYDTLRHIEGSSDGVVIIDYIDQNAILGQTYRVTFNDDVSWNIFRLEDEEPYDTVLLLGDQAVSLGTEPVDGMVIRVLNPTPGMKPGYQGDLDAGWDIPAGTRRWTFAGGADGLGLEGFEGAMGWDSPCYFFGGCDDRGVPQDQVVNVLLKLATVSTDGTFDQDDENISYAYRYLRNASVAAAKPEFEPYIINTSASYAYQDFTKSVPLSAWNVEVDPPQRLAVGFLENNVPDNPDGKLGGLVDGKYWPPDYNVADNYATSGPREWLFVFLADYSETPNPEFQVRASTNPLPIMYMSAAARRGSVPYSPDSSGQDQFVIYANHPIMPVDVFEFSTALPGTVEGTVIANSVTSVHAVPNPYYNVTTLEKDQFNRVLKFVNLPAAPTTIRIFNLAGDLVRTLVKDDLADAEITWDVLTENGLPVASGLYIYHVTADGIGVKVGKVAVFTEVEQLNTY